MKEAAKPLLHTSLGLLQLTRAGRRNWSISRHMPICAITLWRVRWPLSLHPCLLLHEKAPCFKHILRDLWNQFLKVQQRYGRPGAQEVYWVANLPTPAVKRPHRDGGVVGREGGKVHIGVALNKMELLPVHFKLPPWWQQGRGFTEAVVLVPVLLGGFFPFHFSGLGQQEVGRVLAGAARFRSQAGVAWVLAAEGWAGRSGWLGTGGGQGSGRRRGGVLTALRPTHHEARVAMLDAVAPAGQDLIRHIREGQGKVLRSAVGLPFQQGQRWGHLHTHLVCVVLCHNTQMRPTLRTPENTPG